MIEDDQAREKVQSLIRDYQSILRNRAESLGWKLDNTSDLARVLRLPGTFNHKSEPVLVSISKRSCKTRYRFQDIRSALDDCQQEDSYDSGPRETEKDPVLYPKTITSEKEEPNLFAIKEKCPFIRHCMNEQKDLSEPEWYAFLSISARCQNGRENSHEYSKQYPGYTEQETDEKIDHALNDTGPYSCRYIAENIACERCQECCYSGSVASPIQLGYSGVQPKMRLDKAQEIVDNLLEDVKQETLSVESAYEKFLSDPLTHGALVALYLEKRASYFGVIESLEKHKQIKGKHVTRLESSIKETAAKTKTSLKALPSRKPEKAIDQRQDAPLNPTAIVPSGWDTSNGLSRAYRNKSNDEDVEEEFFQIAKEPIFISSKYTNLQDNSTQLDLIFPYDGKWEKKRLPRSHVFQSGKLLQCADYGMSITQNNASQIVEYLYAFEHINLREGIAKYYSSSIFGWQGEQGTLGFLLGGRFFPPDGGPDVDTLDSSATLSEGTVVFLPNNESPNMEHLAKAFIKKGSYEQWLEALKLLEHKAPALFCVYAAFVPPLMGILDMPNFIVDINYTTSSGKTTLQRFLASIYGSTEKNGYLRNWNVTRVFVERLSAVLLNLPLLLNDTKNIKNTEIIDKVVYDITNGTTHGRGTITGIKPTHPIKTVLFSSGETPIIDQATSSGVATRVITLHLPPFEEINSDSAQLINKLDGIINENYGIAGELFIRYLVQNRKDKTEDWKKLHEQFLNHYASKAAGIPYVDRLGKYFAAIDTAGTIAHEALGLPWDFKSPIESLWDELTERSKDPTPANGALEDIYSFCCSNKNAFYPGASGDKCLGTWNYKDDSWETIAIFSTEAKAEIERLYPGRKNEILREWQKQGYIVCDKNRFTKRVGVDGQPVPCIVIRRKKLEDLGICSKDTDQDVSEPDDTDDFLSIF
jgi:hypothetical protein